MSTPAAVTPAINRRRYRRITRFFAGVILNILVWDLFLARLPGLRRRVRAGRPRRFRRHARRFRQLAVAMGGVMIKLGQFLSARVDVLPPEITDELQGLQDEVPPVPFEAILARFQAELGEHAHAFQAIEATPLAAASLGQTHRARLTHGGRSQPVVLKIQRPDIETLVATDLEALRVVARWIMRYRPIRRRANAPALMEEFARTLWEELDYHAEAAHAGRFQAMFAANPGVQIPQIYPAYSTSRVLVMENVEAIKITNLAQLRAAGVDPQAVAGRLLDAYFKQIFEEAYFHADPHPGNLFVCPQANGAFQLVFVDFGMVGQIAGLRDHLRQVLVAITQRDARLLTQTYAELGFFLPGADLERIAEAQAKILNQIWGRQLLELARPDPREVQALGLEFRDLLFEFPFQAPQDFIYLGRALGMISGLVSLLDPNLNPWYYLEQYGQKVIASQEGRRLGREALAAGLRPYWQLPAALYHFLETAQEGRLQLQTQPDRQTGQRLTQLEQRLRQLNRSILLAGALVAGAILYAADARPAAFIIWGAAGVISLWSLWRGR